MTPSKPRHNKYPIYVISKGRHDCCLTAKFLLRDGVDFKIVVEPQERQLYADQFGDSQLLILPFSNLGLGSIPARNWCWEHSIQSGAERHWILDDNIREVLRRYRGIRIKCNSQLVITACEDFVDRYENVAIAGLNYYTFAMNGIKKPPFHLNVHVYSFMIINNDMPYRWRGRYNEDADLCLQVLSGGWCTILFNAFLAAKQKTMTMKGGNTDQLYQNDGRLLMARSLERQWPHIVSVGRRYQRPQHVVRNSWGKFDNQLRLKKGIKRPMGNDEYNMRLIQTGEKIESPILKKLVEAYDVENKGENK